jgi:hypothetical protein
MVAVLLFLGVSAEAGTRGGASQLSLFANFSSSWLDTGDDDEGSGDEEDEAVGLFIGGISYSYFFGPHFSLGLSGTVVGGGSGETTFSTVFLSVRPDLYLGGDTVVPYIGVDVGIATMSTDSGDDDSSDEDSGQGGLLLGGHAGLKFFIGENASLDLEAGLKRFTLESEEEDSDSEEEMPALMTASMSLAVSVYW